jgi:7-carboxy-7-deazaguanine synthase
MATFTGELEMESAVTSIVELPVMEHFYTLQGEGAWAGTPAYFVRLGGCDVGCHWCDVKESWPLDAHPRHTVNTIHRWWQATEAPMVVVTGGEPLMHNLDELTEVIHATGKRAHVETSGTSPFSGRWDWITFSPKRFKPSLPIYYESANELKIIAYNNADLPWALSHAERVHSGCQLYIQPEWDRREVMTPRLIDFVKANPRWRLSLQTHKYLAIP